MFLLLSLLSLLLGFSFTVVQSLEFEVKSALNFVLSHSFVMESFIHQPDTYGLFCNTSTQVFATLALEKLADDDFSDDVSLIVNVSIQKRSFKRMLLPSTMWRLEMALPLQSRDLTLPRFSYRLNQNTPAGAAVSNLLHIIPFVIRFVGESFSVTCPRKMFKHVERGGNTILLRDNLMASFVAIEKD